MKNSLGLVIKVLGLSLILSLVLKYIGPFFILQPTPFNAFIGISLTPITIVILLWRASQFSDN